MTFEDVLEQALALLQRRGRVTYRALKRQFQLDDDYLDDLKTEIIKAQRLAVDEDGEVLVWVGAPAAESPPTPAAAVPPAPPDRPPPVRPIAYTPRHLAERILAEQAALAARGDPDGERKTITALFADIKGSMDLLEELDPEEARQIIDPTLQLMMQAVHRYEGYVAQSLGDGIFALFGAPIAHEDHAQRALFAALRMQEEIRRYAEQLRQRHGVNLEIRVGVNTGEVVVRAIRTDDLHTDYVPIGHATSLAARLQGLASGGAIVMSEGTYRLAEGYVACRPLGTARVKGVREPVALYEVTGVGPLRTRLERSARRGLVRFVGRQPELAQLQRAWDAAQAGRGQLVAVVGEPGVGKSRLCYEFKLRAQRDGLFLETFSVSHGKAFPSLPLIDLLQHYFQYRPEDEARARREKVAGKVVVLDRALEDTLPYLLALLGDAQATAALADMAPPVRRQRTFEAITRVLLRESLNQPLLLLMEDLQWLDSETEAWLQLLSERLATARVLLLVNYRPEYQHAWGTKTYYTQLRLDPLGPAETQELLTAVLGEGALMQPLKAFLLARTDGNPFFMEELLQALIEHGVLVREASGRLQLAAAVVTRALSELPLPATVQGILAARIDRLPPEAKALLQTVAVLGKEFPWRLLTQVVAQPEAEVQRLLAYLQAAEFVYERPAFPDPDYTFKHALTQEVAYNSLLVERRRALHERTGQAIETLFPDRLDEYASALAHHYRQSGNTPKAVAYLQRAGRQAMQRAAYAESIEQLRAALALLTTLPESAERTQQEIVMRSMLGRALMQTQGFGAPEVVQAYTRVRELSEQVEVTPQLFPVLLGLRSFYQASGAFPLVLALGDRLLSLAECTHERAWLVQVHIVQGQTLCFLGACARAQVHLEQGWALYEPQQHRTLPASYSHPGLQYLSYTAVALWMLGYPDQARQRSAQALTLARELAHPASLAYALIHAAWFHQWRREPHVVHTLAETLISLSTEQGYPEWVARGSILRGWALAELGQGEAGMAQMREGLATISGELLRPSFLALLTEGQGRSGQIEAGLHTIAEALALVETYGERLWEAELHRLKGELLLRGSASQQDAAEACLQQALDVARGQQAKALELRAAMSLARLWQRQDQRAVARALLAEVYDWFTEGFDTADLQEARASLEALT